MRAACYRALGLLLLLAAVFVPVLARAANPVDVYEFDSAAQEQRYRALIAEFRCPKCLNTNLEGSDAPIAQDLRRTVYRLAIAEGRSDQEVRDFLQTRYGDFVLYSPPLRPGTYLLWFGPLVLLLISFWVLRRTVRSARAPEPALSADEQSRLNALLKESDS